jgi:hypothetical protein
MVVRIRLIVGDDFIRAFGMKVVEKAHGRTRGREKVGC